MYRQEAILNVNSAISFAAELFLTWKTMPDEIIGVIPISINVPLLLANIIRNQYIGSDVSEDTMPYKGI